MRAKLSLTGVLLVFVVVAAAGCGPSPTVASATPGYSQTDIRTGAGNEAVAGSVVTVEYAGWLLDPTQTDQKGLLFDTSRGSATPFSFTVGAKQVIAGFDEGTVGMRVGGLRRLVIPPSLAYGMTRTGAIPPNATLVFDIELLSLQ